MLLTFISVADDAACLDDVDLAHRLGRSQTNGRDVQCYHDWGIHAA